MTTWHPVHMTEFMRDLDDPYLRGPFVVIGPVTRRDISHVLYILSQKRSDMLERHVAKYLERDVTQGFYDDIKGVEYEGRCVMDTDDYPSCKSCISKQKFVSKKQEMEELDILYATLQEEWVQQEWVQEEWESWESLCEEWERRKHVDCALHTQNWELSDLDYLTQAMGNAISSMTGTKAVMKEAEAVVECYRNICDPKVGFGTALTKYATHVPRNHFANIVDIPQLPSQFAAILDQPTVLQASLKAIQAVSQVLNTLDSISWFCESIVDPKRAGVEMVKMPWTVVKHSAKTCVRLVKHPLKTTKMLVKSFFKAPKYTLKRFCRAIRFKKKKKHKRQEEHPVVPVLDALTIQRMQEKYERDLHTLYAAVQEKCFIPTSMALEEYHNLIYQDWEASGYCAYLCDFPDIVLGHTTSNLWTCVHTVSPRAHPHPPVLSSNVTEALVSVSDAVTQSEHTCEAMAKLYRTHDVVCDQLTTQYDILRHQTNLLAALCN